MTDTTRKRNVLVVESGEGVGGSAFSMFRIVKCLDKPRFDPQVFVYYQSAAFDSIREIGIPVTILPQRSMFPRQMLDNSNWLKRMRNYIALYGNLSIELLTNGLRLARHIRRNNIDLVHCNNGVFENFSAVFAARLTGTPCIAHIRGTEPIMKIEKLVHRWLAKIIVLNKDMYDAYVDVFGRRKVQLVYNGVDLDIFGNADPQKLKNEFSIKKDQFCVGTFARLVEGKGIPEFLQAASEASQVIDNIRFFVAGGGDPDSDFEDRLHAESRRLGLQDKLVFAGWRDDVRDFMSAMDLVLQVSTTYPEGMSLAPIEAMALSRPVIVTDNPGYANIVLPGRTGFVVPVSEIDQLGSLVIKLAQDRELARELGENAYQRVLEEFEYGIVVGRIEKIYDEVLGA